MIIVVWKTDNFRHGVYELHHYAALWSNDTHEEYQKSGLDYVKKHTKQDGSVVVFKNNPKLSVIEAKKLAIKIHGTENLTGDEIFSIDTHTRL